MLNELSKYIFVFITSLVILLEVLRLLKLFFNPPFLRHKRFDFPTDKYTLVGYHLCVIVLGLIVIMANLNLL
jgi:hypothetical protein